MKRVPATVAAAGVTTSLIFFVMSALPVYADANPNNHGHHYGQLKHPKHPPVPTPATTPPPSPVTTPAPTSHPVSAGASQGATPAAGSFLALPVVSPIPVADTPAAQTRTAFSNPVPGDPLWWLLLTILPTLFAAWLIAFRRVILRASRRPRAETPQRAAAPAQA